MNTMLKVDSAALEAVRRALPELALIADVQMREKAERIWAYTWRKSNWDDVSRACFEPGMPHRTLVDHTRVTALGAVAVADLTTQIQGIPIDREAVLVGALLHDVSKLLEYEPDGAGGARISELGKKLQHSVYGAHLMLEEELPLDLVHSVVSHTPQSNIRPFLPEAMLVQYVDHSNARVLFGDAYGANIKFPALKK